MTEHNFTQERIQIRKIFKNVLNSLRKLERYHKKIEYLNKEELEDHIISIEFNMQDIHDTINDQMEILEPD